MAPKSDRKSGGEGGGHSQKNCVGVCGPLSQNPIYDQDLQYSLPYLWPDQKFETLFMTWLLNQNPVSDQRYNKFPSSNQC